MARERVVTGYAPSAIAPQPSRSAAALRRAALGGGARAHELHVRPRAVRDQQRLPCCVSCAVSSAMESLDARWPELSALFHYHVTRFEEHGADPDGFLYLTDALRTLEAKGLCSRALHDPPFTPSGAEAIPSRSAYADASARAIPRRGLRSRVVTGGGDSRAAWVRDQLDRERPVVIGFQLPVTYPASFLDDRHAWLDPDRHRRTAAAHCVVAVGYSDVEGAVHVEDSRGPGAFDRGRWWMGYRVLDSTVVHEVYALVP